MLRHGWNLLLHGFAREQLRRLSDAAGSARKNDPEGYEGNANVKLFNAVRYLMLEVIATDPTRDQYRQGNTLGAAYRHWRRAKIGRRFRLFFRYDSNSKVIVFVWINDEKTLRSAGSKSDPYVVFQKMLQQGNPPDGWKALVAESGDDWSSLDTG